MSEECNSEQCNRLYFIKHIIYVLKSIIYYVISNYFNYEFEDMIGEKEDIFVYGKCDVIDEYAFGFMYL